MFFFKRKKIVVDAFTSQLHVYTFAGIEPATKYIPDWWKALPHSVDMPTASGIHVGTSTMKSCRGFIDLYRRGFVIPMWSDFVMQSFADGTWRGQWSDVLSGNMVDTHPPHQFTGLPGSNIHLKFVAPWMLREKTGAEFMFSPVAWSNPDPDFRIMPGVLNFKYQHSVNINALVRTQDKLQQLNHGDPIVHLIPLTDNEVEIRNHMISTEEFNRLMDYAGRMISFRNTYKRKKTILESKEDAVCPFSSVTKLKSIWPKSKNTSSSGPY